MTAPIPTVDGGRGLLRGCVAAAMVGAVLFALGVALDPARAMSAWLVAFAFYGSIALGALLWWMAVLAMGATWPLVVRRIWETAAACLPVLALAFVPIGLALGLVYPWAQPPELVDIDVAAIVEHKRPWLSEGFFVARAAGYLAVWIAVAELLRRWSLRLDRAPDPDGERRQRALASGALPLVGLTLTFAAFDWLMSLEPTWYSTMFGLWWFAGGFVAAMALTAVVLVRGAERLFGGLVRRSHRYAVGRLLFAFVAFWAYIAFFQFYLVWIADLPEEVQWYLPRLAGAWGGVAAVLVVGHFVLPFLVLLGYAAKQDPRVLAAAGAWLLAMHWLDLHWAIVPSRHASTPVHVADLGALLLQGGAAVACATWRWCGHAAMPRHAANLDRALEYASD